MHPTLDLPLCTDPGGMVLELEGFGRQCQRTPRHRELSDSNRVEISRRTCVFEFRHRAERATKVAKTLTYFTSSLKAERVSQE